MPNIFIPKTKTGLVDELVKYTNYSKKEIEILYKNHLNKNPDQAKYYAKKNAIRVLQGFLYSLKIKNEIRIN